MAADVRVVGLGGSLAPVSNSLAALNTALEGAREDGASTEAFAIADLDLPLYRPGPTRVPEATSRQ